MPGAVPPVHSYLTDGKRLVYVRGYNERGEMLVENCQTDNQFTISPKSIGNWTVVRAAA